MQRRRAGQEIIKSEVELFSLLAQLSGLVPAKTLNHVKY